MLSTEFLLIFFGLWLLLLSFIVLYILLRKPKPRVSIKTGDLRHSDAIEKQLETLLRYSKKSIQHVGIVRFNAFQDIGSDQSFSLALLDANGNGVVLSSIHARTQNRTYAKPIVKFKSLRGELSKEEEKAVALAIEKNVHDI